MFRLGFRRACKLLRQIGFQVATKSTFQRQAIPIKIGQDLLKAKLDAKIEIAAIDGTGLSRCNRSWHYIKRINGEFVNNFYKLSVCINIKNKKFASIRLKSERASNIKDVKLHQFLNSKKIKAIITTRNQNLTIHETKGFFRKK